MWRLSFEVKVQRRQAFILGENDADDKIKSTLKRRIRSICFLSWAEKKQLGDFHREVSSNLICLSPSRRTLQWGYFDESRWRVALFKCKVLQWKWNSTSAVQRHVSLQSCREPPIEIGPFYTSLMETHPASFEPHTMQTCVVKRSCD